MSSPFNLGALSKDVVRPTTTREFLNGSENDDEEIDRDESFTLISRKKAGVHVGREWNSVYCGCR